MIPLHTTGSRHKAKGEAEAAKEVHTMEVGRRSQDGSRRSQVQGGVRCKRGSGARGSRDPPIVADLERLELWSPAEVGAKPTANSTSEPPCAETTGSSWSDEGQ